MKKKIFFVMFFVLAVSLTFGHVNIKYPRGGEEFNAGDTITIKWEENIDHGESDWDLLYSSDGGGNWSVIINDLSKNVHEYQWALPANPTDKGKIKVVQDNKNASVYTSESGYFTINQVTGIVSEESKTKSFELYQAYPNPFNSSTVISFYLPQESHVTLTVFNITGEEIKNLIDSEISAGLHQMNWDASDVSSGIYFYTIQTESKLQTGKVVLLK